MDTIILIWALGCAFNLGLISPDLERIGQVWRDLEPPTVASDVISTTIYIAIWPFTYTYYLYRNHGKTVGEALRNSVTGFKRLFKF